MQRLVQSLIVKHFLSSLLQGLVVAYSPTHLELKGYGENNSFWPVLFLGFFLPLGLIHSALKRNIFQDIFSLQIVTLSASPLLDLP